MEFEINDNILLKYNGKQSVVDVPEGVIKIGEGAFERNAYITEVSLPSTVQAIRENAFNRCKQLTKINLNDGLTYIGKCAFDHCKMLNNVVIPETVTIIGGWAFDGCTNLTECKLPSHIRKCDETAFKGCPFFSYKLQEELEQVIKVNKEKKESPKPTQSELMQKAIEKQLNELKETGVDGYWEYMAIDLIDKGGRVDVNKLTETLNNLGRDGWHLVCAYTNELGKNALSIAGFGINSSVDQNVLIMERFVKFSNETNETNQLP